MVKCVQTPRQTFRLLVWGSALALTAAHAAESPPALVTVAPVEVQQVAPVQWLPANVISRNDAQIASEQAGQIRWVAEVGSRVKRGEALARIDDQALKLTLAEQEAVLQRLRASESYFEKQLQRLQTLLANNSVARTEMDATERDRAINEASIKQQQVLIAQSKLAIEQARIAAPFDGVIVSRRVQPGEYVQIGQPVAQLTDIVGLDVQVQAPLALAEYLARDQRLSVEYGDRLIELPLRSWTPAGNVASRSFEIRLDARALNAMPGMAVRVAVPKAASENALVIPRDALVIREQQMFVLKVTDDAVVQKLAVVPGAGAGERIAVSGELKAGDQVIIRGAESAQPGQKVRLAGKQSGAQVALSR